MRKPFRKNIEAVPVEDAHGGNGSRKLLLSKDDPVSSNFQAMTKGFLPAKGVWDWHQHESVDEYFVVLSGSGKIDFRDGNSWDFGPQDLIYVPADTEHRIENTSAGVSEFFFVRLDA